MRIRIRLLVCLLLFFAGHGFAQRDTAVQQGNSATDQSNAAVIGAGSNAGVNVGAVAGVDSCNLRVSVLTCGPGEDLYSIFGHSAIRIIDNARGLDIVYNYGTMEFDSFSFYLKFIRGEMLYYLSVADMNSFMSEYQYTRRSVIEQPLQLSCEDKTRLLAALQVNASDENKYYNYSFLYDNCSTRIRDIIAQKPKSLIRFNNILPAEVPTFRNMIHEYLHKGEQHWSKLGIDLLLGALIDKKVTNEQAMFLPDYLMKGFDSASILSKPEPGALKRLVSSKLPLYQPPIIKLTMPWFNPYLVITGFSILLLVLSSLRSNSERSTNRIDRTIFFVTGLLGLLMLGLWLGREDTVCRNNMNLIWALPTHAVAAFYIGRNKPWLKTYFRITVILGALLLLGWRWWPQELNNSLIPFVLLLVIRSYTLSKK
jgi:uncharacterized protein DUF4105